MGCVAAACPIIVVAVLVFVLGARSLCSMQLIC